MNITSKVYNKKNPKARSNENKVSKLPDPMGAKLSPATRPAMLLDPLARYFNFLNYCLIPVLSCIKSNVDSNERRREGAEMAENRVGGPEAEMCALSEPRCHFLAQGP